MQNQGIDAEGGVVRAPWIAYRWLQAKKSIRSQQEFEAELRRFAVEQQLNETRGISQSSLSGILSGQRRMSTKFCELMTLYFQSVRNDTSFKFPDDVGILLEEMRDISNTIDQEIIEQSGRFITHEVPSADYEKQTINHLNGAWQIFFYSHREGDLSRKIRRALIIFHQDPRTNNPYAKMSVKSIGETTRWIGACEKIEKYWYVSLDRNDIFVQRMFLILPCPDYWNDILVGMATGIEGRKGNLVHPIVSTKCLLKKCKEKFDFDKLNDDDEIEIIRQEYCGYIGEQEWIKTDMNGHLDFVRLMSNEVSEDDVPFVLKFEPNIESARNIKTDKKPETEYGDDRSVLLQKINGSTYIDKGSIEDANEIFSRVEDLLNELNYQLESASAWKRGSWWRSYIFNMRKKLKSKQVQDRTQIIEDVLFGIKSLDIANGVARSTIELIESLRNHKGTVVIDAGLFIFLKKPGADGEDDIFVKRLTVEERAFLDADPSRVMRPDEILKTIRQLRRVRARERGRQPRNARQDDLDGPLAGPPAV